MTIPLHKHKPLLVIIGVSAITSLVISSLCFFVYFYTSAKSAIPVISSKIPTDTSGNKYESIINTFLAAIQKGDLDAAYAATSPIFQKLTSKEDFKKLINDYTVNQNIPTSSCILTEYSEPSTQTINGIPGEHIIVQTKCEATEKGVIKGFNVELIDDAGTYKISFLNVYKTSVIHKVER